MSTILAVRAAELAWLHAGDSGAPSRIRALLARATDYAVAGWATLRWFELQEDHAAGTERRLDAVLAACEGPAVGEAATAELTAACLGRRFARDGDPRDLNRAVGLWRRSVRGDDFANAVPVWLSPAWRWLELGSALLERVRCAGADGDLVEAVAALRRASSLAMEPAIRAVCVGRLAACDHEDFLHTGRRSSAQRSLRRYRWALARLGPGSPVRPMLLTECGTLHQDRFDDAGDRSDLDQALALGQEGLATGPAQGSDRACHLVNLGTCWDQRYAELGDRADLDRALVCWREALSALPVGSPYRAAFVDRLVVGLLRRWDRDGTAEDVDEAVGLGRDAVTAGSGSPDVPVFANHLADALAQRWKLRHDLADLDEAVDLLRDAVYSSQEAAARAPDLVANLLQLSAVRYEGVGDPAGLEAAFTDIAELPDREFGGGQRATVAAAVAHLSLARYRWGGDLADLAAAIAAARRSLVALPEGATARAPRLGYLAGALFLRYEAMGRRRDLDAAIAVALGDAAENGRPAASPAVIAGTLLGVRYERYGDPVDGRAAVRWARMAVESERDEDAPFSGQGLAVVLHARFNVGGRFTDLDEAVRRQRVTLARLASTAPARPLVLNNLGIALQDRYEYRGARRDLSAAVAAHEEALATCPPRSPERAGLVHSLAAALKVRYEHSGAAADLARLVELNEYAVDALRPRSPERAEFLVNLAAAYFLRARRTGARDHADEAVCTFAAASRRSRPRQSVRAHVLYGYAAALAERHDRFGRPRDRARVRAMHRRAVAASEPIPVLLLDVAVAWGEWSARQGLWSDSADAYRAAGRARRKLIGVQDDVRHKDEWLGRADGLHAAAALALCRTRDADAAVVALDDGRALHLTEALDVRTVADRLRQAGRPDLGARFEEAAHLRARSRSAAAPRRRRDG